MLPEDPELVSSTSRPRGAAHALGYSRRYVLALMPLITLVAGFVAATMYFEVVPITKPYDWTSFAEAIYFAVMTATTIGHGLCGNQPLR